MTKEEKKKVWVRFCENTTLHGWAYVASTNNIVLRCLWLAIILCFFTWAMLIVHEAITNYHEAPMITTIKNYSFNVRNIQFPTITICPKDWPNDRWAFVRGALDEADVNYPCKEEIEDCGKAHDDFDFFFNGLVDAIQAVLMNGAKLGESFIHSPRPEDTLNLFKTVQFIRVNHAKEIMSNANKISLEEHSVIGMDLEAFLDTSEPIRQLLQVHSDLVIALNMDIRLR